MTMTSSLWTDLEAIRRLAVSGQEVEWASRRACPAWTPTPAAADGPSLRGDRFMVHAVESSVGMVGGDFYDFFLRGDLLVFAVADVSGKGVPAALLKSFTRALIRNVSALGGSPGDTLTRVNQILHDARLGAMFVTIVLGWYDPTGGGLRYANAGHPGPFRLGRDGRATAMDGATGPILGILDGQSYADRLERLDDGDRLILYTDGVTEAHSPGGEFLGVDGLAGLLELYAGESPDRLCDGVLRAVHDYQSHGPQDDATLMVLARTA